MNYIDIGTNDVFYFDIRRQFNAADVEHKMKLRMRHSLQGTRLAGCYSNKLYEIFDDDCNIFMKT